MDDYVFRLAFFYEFEYRNFIIEITRCTASPDNRGIQFARPTVIQDWLIIDKLEKISQEYAWSTEMLGEETTLAEDLIFRIQSMTQTHEQTEPTLVTGKYSISDISEDSFRPRREGGLGDKIAWHIQLNLIEALKEHLTILLEKPGRWVNHRDIEGALYLMNASDRSFCTYRVDLVKQNDDGEIAVCKLPKSARIQLSQFTDELIKSKGEHP
ncbi:hypothetical protein BJI67_15615 [Acidihalobacter aeolianus]|uniref:Uncharacterized protein n=2 Tax=Acidihalobacter aeolianus TaxID=2792603 RepID=A0A1D8KBG1_9GAMM|nr:hypothetical protein BJI67_15615 [Acidihalobacter aeolianus]